VRCRLIHIGNYELEYLYCDYGGVIKAFKQEHGLKTSDVAKYLGVDYHTVLSWERGKRKPIYTYWKNFYIKNLKLKC